MVKQKNNLAAKVKEEQALRSSLPALSRQILELAKTEPGRLMAPDCLLLVGKGLPMLSSRLRRFSDTDPGICSILRPLIFGLTSTTEGYSKRCYPRRQ